MAFLTAVLPTKIATNTLVQVLGKVVSASITLAVIVLIGRSLGETLYGEFAKVFVLVELFFLAVDFGFNAVVVRQAIRDPKNEKVFFGNLLGLRLLWASFLFVTVSAITLGLPFNASLSLGFSPLVKLGIFLASLTLLTQAVLTSANAAFQKKLRYDQSVLAICLGSVVKLGLVFYLTASGGSFLYLIGVIVLSEFLTAAIALIFVYRLYGFFPIRFQFQTIKAIFKASIPLGITLVFNLLYFRSDTLVLSFFRRPEEVGNYALGFRFFEVPLVLPIFFTNALYPVLLKSLGRDKNQFRKLLTSSTIFLLGLSIVVSFGIFLLGPLVLDIFFPEGFEIATVALRILILGLPFFYLSAIFMWALIAMEKQMILAVVYGVFAAIVLLLNLLLIPRFGFLAAALVTVFGEGVVLCVSILLTVYFISKRG